GTAFWRATVDTRAATLSQRVAVDGGRRAPARRSPARTGKPTRHRGPDAPTRRLALRTGLRHLARNRATQAGRQRRRRTSGPRPDLRSDRTAVPRDEFSG